MEYILFIQLQTSVCSCDNTQVLHPKRTSRVLSQRDLGSIVGDGAGGMHFYRKKASLAQLSFALLTSSTVHKAIGCSARVQWQEHTA